MGLHEPESNFEPDFDIPAWLCLDCGHSWVPDEGTLEPHGDEYGGFVWTPIETSCPVCGSEETDER